ncbi:MAG: DEAD/DEAH box helicase, partial [Candidatus Sericytochromatia bacterium]
MNQELLWRRIYANEQKVAQEEGLVGPGENYRLTGAQDRALADLEGWYAQGARAGLLEAPTGSGKTAVEFRLAVSEFLRTHKPVVVLVPTRDLARQHLNYFKKRLAGTPLHVVELHGGVAPRERSTIMQQWESGLASIVIGSGLLLKDESFRQPLRASGFLVVDDVHALDPVVHLKPLRGVHTPALFATATPQAVADFLRFKEAFTHVVRLEETPFETPPTAVHTLKARFGEDPVRQVGLAEAAIRAHIASDGRIFVISRKRTDVPRLATFLQKRYGVHVSMLHGEMVDTAEQARRLQKFRQYKPDKTRVAMMGRFRETL